MYLLVATNFYCYNHGSVISDAIGVGAKKKIAKWRINMLEGNVASYSWVFKSAIQMENDV